MTVGQIVTEPMLFHKVVKTKEEAYKRAKELMELVGLKTFHLDRYPHQFSGGQRQRIAIARAIAIQPEFIVLDEPTSSLDVSVQAQIINLFLDFQERFHFSYLFISHNLGLVRFISQRVAIMYLGRIVEMGESEEIFSQPLHPYSKALLSATPVPDPKVEKARKRIILTGGVPSPINRPSGCFFNPRCPFKMEVCEKEYPQLIQISDDHWVACHLVK
jgi:peptide/nickel transport system ATP-binding protein